MPGTISNDCGNFGILWIAKATTPPLSDRAERDFGRRRLGARRRPRRRVLRRPRGTLRARPAGRRRPKVLRAGRAQGIINRATDARHRPRHRGRSSRVLGGRDASAAETAAVRVERPLKSRRERLHCQSSPHILPHGHTSEVPVTLRAPIRPRRLRQLLQLSSGFTSSATSTPPRRASASDTSRRFGDFHFARGVCAVVGRCGSAAVAVMSDPDVRRACRPLADDESISSVVVSWIENGSPADTAQHRAADSDPSTLPRRAWRSPGSLRRVIE
jgi:hypothetical protein